MDLININLLAANLNEIENTIKNQEDNIEIELDISETILPFSMILNQQMDLPSGNVLPIDDAMMPVQIGIVVDHTDYVPTSAVEALVERFKPALMFNANQVEDNQLQLEVTNNSNIPEQQINVSSELSFESIFKPEAIDVVQYTLESQALPTLNKNELMTTITNTDSVDFAEHKQAVNGLLQNVLQDFKQVIDQVPVTQATTLDYIKPMLMQKSEVSEQLEITMMTAESNTTQEAQSEVMIQDTSPEMYATAANDLESRYDQFKTYEQITEKVRIMLNKQESNATLRLDPPELGSIDIKITQLDNKTHIVMSAANESTREMIETQLDKLKDALSNSGLELGHFNLSSQSQRQQHDTIKQQHAQGQDVALGEVSTPVSNVNSSRGVIDLYI